MVHAGSIGLFIVKISLFWQLEASYERNHCDLRGSEKFVSKRTRTKCTGLYVSSL